HFWERFALMKVRAVAGDPAFRERVETEARNIAFAVVPDAAALDELESLRKKLAAAATAQDLKRREGGIAEIEFATRLLQLKHVRGCPDLKRGGVFAALEILNRQGFIAEHDYAVLRDGYDFFRRVLNRARMMRGSSSSKLPEAPEAQRRLAACLNMDEDILEAVESRARRVHEAYRRIHEQVRT
ncbi:MAG TPA: hypothetical protein ENN29_06610, partial [Candidatus Hydrogenedentes bacterium]|nr:hypothetical protein [Candidatus Hydrogenedentota bacterium]